MVKLYRNRWPSPPRHSVMGFLLAIAVLITLFLVTERNRPIIERELMLAPGRPQLGSMVLRGPPTVFPNVCTGYELHRRGHLGRAIAAAKVTRIKMDAGETASVYNDPYCSNKVAEVIIPAGASFASFYFKDSARNRLSTIRMQIKHGN